jgi:CRISPR-associated protein Cmr1
MIETLTISIRTLTPIWTGDVNGQCSVIKETGIIGSMRWWYEAIVRGMGGYTCDPSKHECSFEIDKYENAKKLGKNEHEFLKDAGLCVVCQIFGATGWKRQFNLSISKDETKESWSDNFILNVRPPQRSHGWFLPPGRSGNFEVILQGESAVIGSLCSLFLFLESWGALGAKSQLGYGFFKITNRDEVQKRAIPLSESGNKDEKYLPNLSHWLFFSCHFKQQHNDWWTWIEGLQRLLGDRKTAVILSQLANQGMVPVSPILKNQWRFEKWDAEYPGKRWLLGTSKGDDRIRSKVAVSWAYREGDDWIVRGWGSLAEPDKPKEKIPDYPEDIGKFKEILKDKSVWRKALNLDSVSLKELQVFSEKEDVLKLLEIKYD